MTLATQWNSLGLFLYENRDILFSQIYNQICINFKTSCTDNLYMMTAKGATYYIQVAKQKGKGYQFKLEFMYYMRISCFLHASIMNQDTMG